MSAALEQTAIDAARRAGELIRRAYHDRPSLSVERKGLRDYVTEIDRAAEAAVVGLIRERFPDHEIMAEEGSPDAALESHRWIVDPLDGTTNFIHGVPTFAVSVAVQDVGGLLAGAIYEPLRDEMFHAGRGRGARLNGTPIGCTAIDDLEPSILATGFPFRDFSRLEAYLACFERFVRATSGVRRAGSAAIDLAYTACGRYDGFWEIGLSPWDVAAGSLIVREAGGIVTDPAGDPDRFLEAGDVVAAGKGLHGKMIEITAATLAGSAGKR